MEERSKGEDEREEKKFVLVYFEKQIKNIPLGGALARTILPGGGLLGGAPRGKAVR